MVAGRAAAELVFRVGAELTEIKAALAGLRKDFADVGQAAQRASGRNAFDNLKQSAQSATASIGTLIASLGLLSAAVKAIGKADELANLNARLKLATNSTEELTRAQEALFEMAQRSRTDLAETVDLYAQIAFATKNAGVGQETLLQVVETINQAVQLSGSSAQAAHAALVQLGQGLASGTLRGEELNSVLEQTPALADAIAKGMGITREELRAYGEAGKISAQQVIKALQKQREEIAAQFAKLPLTVGQSVTLLRNSVLRIIGTFNEASGATAGLAKVIKSLSDFLSSDDAIGGIVEYAALWSKAFRLIEEDAKRAVGIMRESSGDIERLGKDLIDFLGRAFEELPINIRTAIQIVTVHTAALFDRLVSYAEYAKDRLKAIFSSDIKEAAYARFKARNDAIRSALQTSVDDALAERAAALAAARAAREEAARRRAEGLKVSDRTGSGTFRKGKSDADQKKGKSDEEQLRKAELDAEERRAKDMAERQLASLKRLFDDAGIAAADYYRRREELELASLDRIIAIERMRAAAGGVEAVRALAEVELLERRKTDVVNQAARDRAEFQRNLDRQLEQARISLLASQGQTVEAARLRAEATYRDLIARLQAEGDSAGVALINKLIGSEVADAELQALQQRISDTISNLRGTEGLIAAQVDAGILPQLEAERQLQALRNKSIEQLRQYRDALLAVAAAQTTNGGIADPRVLQQVQALDTEIARVTASQRMLENSIRQSAQSSLSGFFADLAAGARSFSDAVKAAALTFIQSLARMAAEALAKRAILALGNAGGGGGGGFFHFLASLFHTGGIVGQGGGRRMVNPLVFVGAPRMHSGGMVGLRADERPAILQTGEEVLARDDPRNRANGGGAGFRVVNVLDPSLVSNYLESAAGERVILNVIGRNPQQVSQLIGR